jgi:uncharacterized protein with HEPN domain
MIRELDYLEHMLECIAVIEDCYAKYDNPLSVAIVRDGVLRNLQITAQSAMRLPSEMQARYPEINWSGLRAFRNILVHDYMDVSLERVNELIEQGLPALKHMAQAELARLEPDGN